MGVSMYVWGHTRVHICACILGVPRTPVCGSSMGEPVTGGWHRAFLTAPAMLLPPEQFGCHVPCELGLNPQFTDENVEAQGEKMTWPKSPSESVVAGTVSALFSAVTPAPTQDLTERPGGEPRKWLWNE